MTVNNEEDMSVELSGRGIGHVDRYIDKGTLTAYFGSMLTKEWTSEQEILSRTAMLKEAFNRRKNNFV